MLTGILPLQPGIQALDGCVQALTVEGPIKEERRGRRLLPLGISVGNAVSVVRACEHTRIAFRIR